MSFPAFGAGMPVIPDIFFPEKAPGTFATFTYDAISVVGTADPIVSASFAAMPSGDGEVTPSLLSVVGTVVSVWLANGVAGRDYIYLLALTTSSGQTYDIYIGQVCDPLLATVPIVPSPVPGFGTPVVWTYVPSLDFTIPMNSGYIGLIAGF